MSPSSMEKLDVLSLLLSWEKEGFCQSSSSNFTWSPLLVYLELKKLIFCKCLRPAPDVSGVYLCLAKTNRINS